VCKARIRSDERLVCSRRDCTSVRVDLREVEVAKWSRLDRSEHILLHRGTRFRASIGLVACPRQHRSVILNRADDTWMIWPVPHRRLEDDSLIVALALAFGLDAVCAGGSLFATLYSTFAAGETASLGSFPHF